MTEHSLPNRRILAIDVFRGLTILTMVFVNELAAIKNIPSWMTHMPADANAMTFVDLVFPAFLFIVGMSIPFSTQAKAAKGASSKRLLIDAAFRALGLIVIGLFMVNTIYGYDESKMLISMPLWTLLMYASVLLIWSHYPKHLSSVLVKGCKYLGILGLIVLAYIYEGPYGGMTPQWWGILGLIGWAFIFSVAVYLFTKQDVIKLIAASLAFVALYFVIEHLSGINGVLDRLVEDNRNHTHATIVLAGVVMSLIFYHAKLTDKKWFNYFAFVFVSGALTLLSWWHWPVSKIWATPSWAFMSIFFCALIFGAIYYIVELKAQTDWCKVFEPAANNPLLIYILPYILIAALQLLSIPARPEFMSSGVMGIVWSLGFAVMMMFAVTGLNKLGVRLKL
ncbi:heparan-alpha-glucosaminide N-acetyltransferase domain-containing protein [Pseudoalteromonas sp. SS15]|uniref:heparan-alpha-glucosaminide N-acetyltransferase domain-containing protein n=1 Tax=Pseudoalteromonas sp. SS15 TaxID=3139393 RepID=UPI003BADBCC9